MKSLPNIEYLSGSVVDSPTAIFTIHFVKPEEYFGNLEARTSFINAVETLVRTSDRYSKYKDYLFNEVKLDHCQVMNDINKDDCDIELHHGPIFNLFEICSIVLEYYLLRKWKVTTYRIADTVLREHEENHINCVMLSTTVHEEVHLRNIFISMSQAWGDMNAFIDKYKDAIGPELRLKYNRYIDSCLINESYDEGLFDLNDKLFIPSGFSNHGQI